MTGFAITGSKGFHITFKNGVTVSVQFGGGSYCQNHDNLGLIGKEHELKVLESVNAEVAIWGKGGAWITKEFCPNSNDDVLGWQTPEQVLEALNWANQLKESLDELCSKENGIATDDKWGGRRDC
mgnify:CR=1 FL=1